MRPDEELSPLAVEDVGPLSVLLKFTRPMVKVQRTVREVTGMATMSPEMGNAREYYEWVYTTMEPHLGARVLEVGPGFGTFGQLVLEAGKRYFAIDRDDQVIEHLKEKLKGYDQRATVLCGDITELSTIVFFRSQGVDTVVSMNVLEHLENLVLCLRAQKEVLSQGCVISFVPAFQMLYGKMDEEAGHYRRYSRSGVVQLYEDAGLEVIKVSYFNALGAIGWFISGRILQNGIGSSTTNALIQVYRRFLLPVARVLDRPLSRLFGQSVLATGRVRSERMTSMVRRH